MSPKIVYRRRNDHKRQVCNHSIKLNDNVALCRIEVEVKAWQEEDDVPTEYIKYCESGLYGFHRKLVIVKCFQ